MNRNVQRLKFHNFQRYTHMRLRDMVKQTIDHAIRNQSVDQINQRVKGNFAMVRGRIITHARWNYKNLFFSERDIADFTDQYFEKHWEKEVKRYMGKIIKGHTSHFAETPVPVNNLPYIGGYGLFLYGGGVMVMGPEGLVILNGNGSELLSKSSEFLNWFGNGLTLGEIGLAHKGIAKVGEITVGTAGRWNVYSKDIAGISKTTATYFRWFGRIAGLGSLYFDYKLHEKGSISKGRFGMNTAYTIIGIAGGYAGFGVSVVYYFMGDVLGMHDRAEKEFEEIIRLPEKERLKIMREKLRKRRGMARPIRNPKF